MRISRDSKALERLRPKWAGYEANLCNVTARLREHQNLFVTKGNSACRKMFAKVTLQLSGIIPKLLPPIGRTVNALVWKLGT